MSSLILNVEPLAQSVSTSENDLVVNLTDGRVLSAPLVWFPRLHNATAEARKYYELMGNGVGIHWPDLDEDISVAGLLAGRPSIEHHA
jgi:selenophosphate synthetase-related protein